VERQRGEICRLSLRDSLASRGAKGDYAANSVEAPTIEVVGRRHAFPQKAIAFPTGSAEGARNADIGPTFRFDVVPEKKK
jgi:hypothetical protein